MSLPHDPHPHRRGRRGHEADAPPPTDYHALINPYPPLAAFSDERIEAMHQTALRVLEKLGMRILLPEARQLFARAGALVDEDSQMVRIGRELVEAALSTAPREVILRGADRAHDLLLAPGRLSFKAGSGSPHVSDRLRGRRPSTLADIRTLVRLCEGASAIQFAGGGVEAQDVPVEFRHLEVTRLLMAESAKVPFVYARGTAQSQDGFEIVRLARGIDRAAFEAEAWSYTVINTNSPRQLDVPMARGLIDFARAGQLSIVTPFCLAGAMAPVTVAGALTLGHAEALAAIALSQIARPGAPVLYGAFHSNVDMKSGAPAFGTPEQIKATLGAGQLARRIGLPWRSATGCAANTNDAQAAEETALSTWAAMLAGASVVIHAVGWLEGGLTVSLEKVVTDLEIVETLAELCLPTPDDDDAIAFDAIAEVPPGGHFFGAAHTMARYRTAFHRPVIADWSNIGTWTERGCQTSDERATAEWQRRVAAWVAPPLDPARAEAIDAFVARRRAEGGAHPVG